MEFNPRLFVVATGNGFFLYGSDFGRKKLRSERASLLSAGISGFQTYSEMFVGRLRSISLGLNGVESKMTLHQHRGEVDSLNFVLSYDYPTHKKDVVPQWLELADNAFMDEFIGEGRTLACMEDFSIPYDESVFSSFNERMESLESELRDMVSAAPDVEPQHYLIRNKGVYYMLKSEEALRCEGQASPPGAPKESATLYFPPDAPVELAGTFHALSNFAEDVIGVECGTDNYHCSIDFEGNEVYGNTTAFLAAKSKVMSIPVAGTEVSRKFSNLLIVYTDRSEQGFRKRKLIDECNSFIDEDEPMFLSPKNPKILVPADDTKYRIDALRQGWYERGLYNEPVTDEAPAVADHS